MVFHVILQNLYKKHYTLNTIVIISLAYRLMCDKTQEYTNTQIKRGLLLIAMDTNIFFQKPN